MLPFDKYFSLHYKHSKELQDKQFAEQFTHKLAF